MKKNVWILILAIVGTTGCVKETPKVPQTSSVTEDICQNKSESSGIGHISQGNNETEQNDFSDYESTNELDDYMKSIEEQSDSIKDFLEHDALTQADMNEKSQELHEHWDNALNDLWGKLKNDLPEKDFEELLNEQRTWIAEKEKAVEEVGKEVEGGSLYSLVVNSEAAKITEERVYELYKLLKELEMGK